ncbi:hypothetical protein GDO86_008719 [Hymenochirus boettgeri]|uniref:Uncharacterized protein n=1 Tax=Hymenochirus boettgeri TaxID=247094 RepID=A0A8T2J2U4_9PIPI|nr:hypothetical protein GDO86_008719 [Hymenochirus boettgeri]
MKSGGSSMPPAYDSQGQGHENRELMSFSGQQSPSTVVHIASDEPPVKDHLIWSIFNLVHMNFCCLGLLALVFSVKSRDRKHIGDRGGAAGYGTTSRSLNIAATTLSVIFIVIFIILMFLGVIKTNPYH